MNATITDAPGTLGIGDAARQLGVSEELLRKREREGLLHPLRVGPRRQRRYTPAMLREAVESGSIAPRKRGRVSTRTILEERVPLSYDDQQECVRIAECVASSIVRRSQHTAWDDAFEDALLGVVTALSRPTDDCPWQVACYAQARWTVLSGIRKRSGIASDEYKAGKRWTDLPRERQHPASLEALLDEEADYDQQKALDWERKVDDRIRLEQVLATLDSRSRMILVNSFAHQFELREIAAELGISPSAVQAIRARALDEIRAAGLWRLVGSDRWDEYRAIAVSA